MFFFYKSRPTSFACLQLYYSNSTSASLGVTAWYQPRNLLTLGLRNLASWALYRLSIRSLRYKPLHSDVRISLYTTKNFIFELRVPFVSLRSLSIECSNNSVFSSMSTTFLSSIKYADLKIKS